MSRTMGPLVLQSTTALTASVARHAATLKNAMRQGFSRTTRPQSDYVRSLKKSVLSSERCKAVELVVSLVVDLAQRGSEEEAAAIGEHLIAIARVEHAAANPADDAPRLSVQEAQLLEEEAEGVVERAEMAMAQNPDSVSHKLIYLRAAGTHARTRRQLDEAVQRQVALA